MEILFFNSGRMILGWGWGTILNKNRAKRERRKKKLVIFLGAFFHMLKRISGDRYDVSPLQTMCTLSNLALRHRLMMFFEISCKINIVQGINTE